MTKKFILSASLFLAIFLTANAQSLTLHHQGADVSNGEINIQGEPSDEEIKVVINITNTTSTPIDVKVKKNVRADIEGAINTFCLGNCFDPSVTESPVAYTLNGNTTTGYDDFYVQFFPNGNSGTAQIIYEVFDSNNPDDKVTVTVNFTIETFSPSFVLHHGENDVSNGEMTIEGKVTEEEIKVVIFISNTSSTSKDIKVKKRVIEDINGSENTFCLGSCFDPSITESPITFTIEPGTTTTSDDFYVLFLPNGNDGTAVISYEIFDSNNVDDNVTIQISFVIRPIIKSLTLTYNEVDVSNDEITIEGSVVDDEIKVDLSITNSSANDLAIKVRKTVIENINGAENTFCLGTSYDPSVTESPNAFTLAGGATTGTDDFYLLFLPNNNSGLAKILYEVFDSNEPENNVFVTVNFNIQPLSVDFQSKKNSIVAYPNPANGGIINIEHSLLEVPYDAYIVITNVLGSIVYQYPVKSVNGKYQINVSSFPKGIYTFSYILSGKILTTSKLVIVD